MGHNFTGRIGAGNGNGSGGGGVSAAVSVTNLSFKNDDYNYLINNNELIMTCREALMENEDSIALPNPEELNLPSCTSSGSFTRENIHGEGASSSGLGLTKGSAAFGSTSSINTKTPLDYKSLKEFSKWINRLEERLSSVCYCSFIQGNVYPDSSINNQISDQNYTKPQSISSASNNLGHHHHQQPNQPKSSSTMRTTTTILPNFMPPPPTPTPTTSSHREWTDAIAEHKVIQVEIQSVGRRFINSIKANAKISKSLLTGEETRWHNLWLKSFEYLMLVEEHQTCPNHTAWNRERTSTPHSNSKRFKYGPFSEGKENRGMMRNRRIQTNVIGIGGGPGLNDNFNVPTGKFEIIHKDIGYSSDADMSDACEPTSCPNYINSNAKSPRKRHRRRRPRIGERPWSFHSEWTGWDYYQPPLGFSGEYRSSEDINSFEDENLVRSLTEFGENYERWFKTDDGIIKGSEEESSARSATESTSNSDPIWLNHHSDGSFEESNSLIRGKNRHFITSSPNLTCSSLTNGIERGSTFNSTLDDEDPDTTNGEKQSHGAANKTFTGRRTANVPAQRQASTFIITNNINNNYHNNNNNKSQDAPDCLPVPSIGDDTDADADIDVLNDGTSSRSLSPPLMALPDPQLTLSSNSKLSTISTFHSSSTQTHPLPEPLSKPATRAPTSTKYFLVYLTITLLMAFILSLVVATLSPITPHVQKSYPNRSPPN